jgi:hypothetical protein
MNKPASEQTNNSFTVHFFHKALLFQLLCCFNFSWPPAWLPSYLKLFPQFETLFHRQKNSKLAPSPYFKTNYISPPKKGEFPICSNLVDRIYINHKPNTECVQISVIFFLQFAKKTQLVTC